MFRARDILATVLVATLVAMFGRYIGFGIIVYQHMSIEYSPRVNAKVGFVVYL